MAGFAPLAFSQSDHWALEEGKVGSRARDVGGFLAFVGGLCFTVEGLLDLRDVDEDRCAAPRAPDQPPKRIHTTRKQNQSGNKSSRVAIARCPFVIGTRAES
jgi:hypothetical protein